MPSRELTAYRFQRSFYEAGKRLPKRTRAQFYAGVLGYYFEGAEPDLPKAAADLFEGFRERIAMARTKALGAAENAAPTGNTADSGGLASGYPTSKARVADKYSPSTRRVADAGNARSTGEAPSEVHGSPQRVLSTEAEGGEMSTERDRLGASFLKDARTLPEFLGGVRDECEAQGAFELLEGDSVERWATYWIERGWRDRNGRSLDELVDDGEGERVERWRLMLRGLCEKAKGDSGGGDGWWD